VAAVSCLAACRAVFAFLRQQYHSVCVQAALAQMGIPCAPVFPRPDICAVVCSVDAACEDGYCSSFGLGERFDLSV
jgi:hypothetical protein